MYRYIFNITLRRWEIEDPEGDVIATVETEAEAEALVSHLNRN